MAQVRIPELLRELTGGRDQVAIDAASAADLIEALDRTFPGFADRLLDDSGLRRYWCVYVNGRDTRFGEGIQTSVEATDVVWILPTSSGGMYLP
jgi:sulfur-carrier protein